MPPLVVRLATGEYCKVRSKATVETKMRARDITRQEVLEALAAPQSQHRWNAKHNSMNVDHRVSVSGKTLRVAYRKQGEEIVVVSAHWIQG